jgi:hypothetical protein
VKPLSSKFKVGFVAITVMLNGLVLHPAHATNTGEIRAESGFTYFDSMYGAYMTDFAVKISNSNTTKSISSCKATYSLLRSNGSVYRSNISKNFYVMVPPASTRYGKVPFILNDSSYGESWRTLRIDSSSCTYIGKYASGSPLRVTVGEESLSNDYIRTVISIFNPTSQSIRVVSNVGIVAPSGSIVSATVISGDNSKCFPTTVKSGETISCWISRLTSTPFASFLIYLDKDINFSGSTASSKYSPTLSVGSKISGKTIAISMGVSVSKNSKISVSVSKASKRFCKVKSGKIVGVKKGSCRATVTVQAPKSKAGKKPKAKTVSVTIRVK